MSGSAPGTIRADHHDLGVHRPEKVLFPDDGFTKADLVAHYRDVAPLMLPHLRGRPLMLEHLPDGLGGPRFMRKQVPDHYPQWVHRATLPKQDGEVTHVVCDDTATLLLLADDACLTPHRWLARADRPHHPDRLVFDLDPGPAQSFAAVREAAHRLGELLDALGLPSALMTTGLRGLHVTVPLDRRADHETVLDFAHAVAEHLAERHPDDLTTATRKAARGDRLFLDVGRNGYAQTAVAPYAVRALPGAPVAAPISWAELDEPGLDARRWTLATIAERLAEDPWGETLHHGHGLAGPRQRLAHPNGS